MLHDRNGCFYLLCAFAGYFCDSKLYDCMIDTRYCLLQDELDVTYTC